MTKLLALSAATLLTLSPLASRAEAERGGEAEESEEPAVEVELEDVTGAATLRATEERSAIFAHVHSVQVAAHLRVSEAWEVWGYAPFTFGLLTERGETTSEATVGNMALAVDRIHPVGKHSRFEYELLAAAPTALGDPLSEDDETERHAMINGLSAAVRGLEDDELYFSKRASLVPRIDFVHDHAAWTFTFFAKAPFLFRAGGVNPPEGSHSHVNAVAIDGVVGAQATCALAGEMESTRGFAVASGGRVVMDYFFKEPIDDPAEAGLPPEQFFAESILMARYGAFRGRMGVLVPMGGRLLSAHEHVHSWRFSVAWAH